MEKVKSIIELVENWFVIIQNPKFQNQLKPPGQPKSWTILRNVVQKTILIVIDIQITISHCRGKSFGPLITQVDKRVPEKV